MFFLVWGLVPMMSWVSLPQIAPGQLGTPRPFEMMGTAMVAIAVAHLAWPLGDGVPWLSEVSARGVIALRARRMAGLTGVCLVVAGLSALPLIRAGVEPLHLVGVALLVWSGAVLGSTWLGRRAAVVLPLTVMVLASRAHLLPWGWNVVFNTETTGPLWVAASIGLVAASVGFSVAGEGTARRAVKAA